MINEQLARILLDERLYQHNPQWQQARAARLASILQGVADAPSPSFRLFDNLLDEVQGDPVAAYDLAGLLLDNIQTVESALAGGPRQ